MHLDVIDGGEAGLETVDDGGGRGVHHSDELFQIDYPVVVDVAKGEDSVYFLNKTTFTKRESNFITLSSKHYAQCVNNVRVSNNRNLNM
jgi:hypothetical protein